MEYPDEVVQQNVYLRGLKIAVFALAFLGVVILLLSFKADNAAAVPVPSFSGTLYVTGNTVWDSGTATWSGSLYVQNGATLTMKNCQVTLSYSYQYFYVYDGATVSMNNVSLINNNNIYGTYFWFSGTANIRINNTYMKNVYYMYICGYNTQITNSSIVNGYMLYIYTYGSSNWGSEGPILRNNLITGMYYPIYGYMWGAGGAKPVIEGNLLIQNQYYLYLYYGGNWKINNNTIIRNNNYGIYMYQPTSLEFNGNIVQNNAGVGIYIYYLSGETVIKDNTITQNAGADMNLYSAKIRSVHNNIGKVACQQNSELNVYWYMDVYVEWEDGSGPVADADLEFLDSMNAGILTPTASGADGWVKGMEVLEYTWNDKGQQKYSPYQINATKYDIKATTIVTVDRNAVAKLVLDNVPPILQLEAPVDKMLTNKNLVLVRGLTEPGAICTVNTVEVEVLSSGWFETNVNYTTDGAHTIKVVCKDPSKNSRDTSRTIITDTKAPVLTITSPTEGELTNQLTMEVIGETEPGAFAEIDGRTVSVDNNGIFSRIVTLSEGDNQIFVKAWDKAGNMKEANVSLKLDTLPPNLVVLEPTDRTSFSTPDIKVVGFIEDGSVLKINGNDVRYQGSSFQYSVRLADGDNTITVEAWDKATNYNTRTITVSLDRKPATLIILTPTENTFTNQKMVLISGQTDPTSTIVINGDGVAVDASTGYFEKSLVLKGGTNKFSVVATNRYGGSISKSVTVVQDLDAPDLTILTPDNGTVTNQETIRIEGIAELGATVNINGKDVSVDKGKFNAYVKLEEGSNEVLVVARDDALNARSAKIFIIRDSTVDLRVSSPYDGMYTTDSILNITGSTEAGCLVYVNTNLKASMDMEGKFRAQLALELGQNDITVSATDSLGNTKTINMVITREEPAAPPPPKKTTTSTGTAVASPMWLGAFLFLGLVVGAAIMGGVYITTRRRMEENTKDQIEQLLTKRFDEKRAEEARIDAARAAGPSLIPKGYKGPPIHIAGPVQSPTMRQTAGPASMPPGPPQMSAQPRNLVSAQGEVVAPSEETVMDIDPELSATEQRVRNAEAKGIDTSKARNSLKLAKFFMSKGDHEKMGKYVQKTKEVLDEIGA